MNSPTRRRLSRFIGRPRVVMGYTDFAQTNGSDVRIECYSGFAVDVAELLRTEAFMIDGEPAGTVGDGRVQASPPGWDDSANELETIADLRDDVADGRDIAAHGRDLLAASRQATANERDKIAAQRDALADERDWLAGLRDELATLRDQVAERHERVVKRDELRDEALREPTITAAALLQAEHARNSALQNRNIATTHRQLADGLRDESNSRRDTAGLARKEAEIERESVSADRQEAKVARLAELDRRLTWKVVVAILASIPDALVAVDADGVIAYVNDKGESLFGWSKADLLGKTIEVLVPDAHQVKHPTLRSMYSASPVSRVMGAGIELSARRRDGSEFPAEISLSASSSGPERWVLAVIRDVTNARQVAHELETARSDAVHANAAKDEFLSRMSHELRTPLNAILGFGQLLLLEPLRDDQRTSVGHIVRAGRHLLELIDEVLDIARIERGAMKLHLEPIDLREVASYTIGLMRPLATQRQIHVHVDEGSIAVHLDADQQRLRQVLLNLVSNAIKYNRPGGNVHISGQARPEGRFRVLVRDGGLGISLTDTKLLFEPFRRLAAEHGDVEGVGLGLALSKQLITLMGGDIGVISRVGEGSTFWIELAVATLEAPVEIPLVHTNPTPNDTVTRPSTILYVEDDLANVRLFERIVARRPGVTLIVAMQGSVALELAAVHHPDIILLDLNLPDMSGDQVLRQLKANQSTAGITVVIVSADASSGAAQRLRELGAADYITKPFDIPRILSIIDTAAEPDTLLGPESVPDSTATDSSRPVSSEVDGTSRSTTPPAPVIDSTAGNLDLNAFLHDLNNHLGTIVSYSEILLGSGLPSSTLADVQEIKGAAQRAAHEAATYFTTSSQVPPDPTTPPP